MDLAAPARKPRGFPFRLLFWAVLMTVAAGAGGYFTWKFRDQSQKNKSAADACASGRDNAIAQAKTDDAASCKTQLDQVTAHSKEADAALTKMSENLNATKGELEDLRKQKAQTEDRMNAIAAIVKQFDENKTLGGNLKVETRNGSLVVALPSEVLFDSGKAKLSRDGEVTVLQVGGILAQFADRKFLVVGHTDATPPVKGSPYKDNWDLSVQRALTVTRYLIEGHMDPKNLIAAGAGDSDPIGDNTTPEGQAQNRRIEIVLLPSLSELPPLPATP